MQNQLFLGGQWVPGEGPPLEVIDPSTGGTISSIHTPSRAQIDTAVALAQAAQRTLRETPGAVRGQWLEKLAQELSDSRDSLAALESQNIGKPLKESLLDVDDAITCLTYYAHLARDLDGEQERVLARPTADFEIRLRYEPVGVAVLVIPWNFPLLTSLWKLAPALAAGCPCILKPSEFTPLSALALAELTRQCGLPAGALSVLSGDGKNVGEALCRHPSVAKISFTGSTATGEVIARVAAPAYKRLTVEAGGKSPIIVFDDVPTATAVEWIMFGAFFNQGEVCNATSRVLLHSRIHAAVVEQLVWQTRRLVLGPPSEPAAQMGPLQNRPQLEKFLRYVELGRQQGAGLLCGGDRDPVNPHGYFVRPAIFDNVAPTAAIWREEVFGPLMAIRGFATEEEAISLANDTDYGLAAAVLSTDLDRAARVARALDAGCVWINCSGAAFVNGPWGGFKRSGVGRELGRWGLEAFLEPKQVTSYQSSAPWGWYLK